MAKNLNFSRSKIYTDIDVHVEEYLPAMNGNKPRSVKIYTPKGVIQKRILIIFCHAGGGTMDDGDWWCLKEYAPRGAICFSPDTGDSPDLVGGGYSPEKVIEGLLNLRVLIGWARANKGRLGINGLYVIPTGVSFGGFLSECYNAAQNKFMDPNYTQFISPLNDLYKRVKKTIYASAAMPGACPIEYRRMIATVDSGVVANIALHAIDDATIPIREARATRDAFALAGAYAFLKEYPDGGHKLENKHDDVVLTFVNQLADLLGVPSETIPS